jgi:sugar/nucleoside kinase (ribokinase family)
MPARLLYTGQVVVDLVMALDALPRSGGDVLASSAKFETGGGFNVMAAACRNGMQTVYLGRHGSGRFGDLARQAMAAEGIEIATPGSDDQDTGLSVALIEPSAERSFISYVGAEGGLSREDLRSVTVLPEDYVCVSGYSLLHKGKVSTLLEWLGELPKGAGRGVRSRSAGELAGRPRDAGGAASDHLVDQQLREALRFTGCDDISPMRWSSWLSG